MTVDPTNRTVTVGGTADCANTARNSAWIDQEKQAKFALPANATAEGRRSVRMRSTAASTESRGKRRESARGLPGFETDEFSDSLQGGLDRRGHGGREDCVAKVEAEAAHGNQRRLGHTAVAKLREG